MLGTYALSSGYYDAYYGTAQKVRTKIAEDFETAFERFDFIVTPDQPVDRVRARLQDRRSAGDVPERLLHRADVAGRDPRDLDPVRAERRPAGRVPARGPAFSESRLLDAAYALERAIGVRRERGAVDERRRGDVMTAYEPVIGLEIHVQLSTRTKMFCGCELSFGDPPNTHTCPVCLGLPGALPVVNERAVHFGMMIGLALGCEIAERSLFHRKNYFYPDLPKGYQISQYDVPLCRGGRLGDVRIHRVHLEEDAAKLNHLGDERPDPRLGPQLGRLQPRRHAAGRDRDRARPALARAGARLARRCCGRR